jgi:hypothetical protein
MNILASRDPDFDSLRFTPAGKYPSRFACVFIPPSFSLRATNPSSVFFAISGAHS